MLKKLLPWALVALLLAGLTMADSCRTRSYEKDLAKVKAIADSGAVDAAKTRAVAAMLRDEARRDSVRLAGALARNDTLGHRLTVALAHVPPPILQTPPDTCLPWAQRAQALEIALDVAKEQLANLPSVVTAAEDRVRHLQAATDTLDLGLGRSQLRLETIKATVPTKLRTTTASVYIGARYTLADGWPHGEAGVQYHALYAGVDAQPLGGVVQVRGVVGARIALRLW